MGAKDSSSVDNNMAAYSTCRDTKFSHAFLCNSSYWEIPLNFEESDYVDHIVQLIVSSLFVLVVIVGLFGNFLVLCVVALDRNMRNTTNLLITNLAVADLMFIIFCVPFTAVDYIFKSFQLGTTWCQIVQYLIVVTAYASVYTLVLMSVDRFLAVVFPISSITIRTEGNAMIAVALMWALILVISLPVFFSHAELPHLHRYEIQWICRFSNTHWTWASFQISFTITSYIIPLGIICLLYILVIRRLFFGITPGGHTSAESLRSKRRVLRMVVVVVVVFSICWGPIQFLLLLKTLKYYRITEITVYLQIILQVLAYMNSCLNPILYAFLSENFRKAFTKVIYCCRTTSNYSAREERSSYVGRKIRRTETNDTTL